MSTVVKVIFQKNKMLTDTFSSVIWDQTNAAIFLCRLAASADRPAGTLALCVLEMSSGGEKQPPSVPPHPQVSDPHLATPNTPSGTYYQPALLLYFWLQFSYLFSSPSRLSSVCSPASFPPCLLSHTFTGLNTRGWDEKWWFHSKFLKGSIERSMLLCLHIAPTPLRSHY